MSPPTILRWLNVYLVEVVRQVKSGEYPEDYGRKVVKGLKYSIAALEEQAAGYRKAQRDEFKEEVKAAKEW